ncbi:MAG TPA: type I methionyl aminopeptidase [Candidatus Limnocylindrales bacterium]|nr:type I methionyl aminopeptidase [Candidatus Limnocylindrales bacterium]
MGVILKSREEINKIKVSCRLVAELLKELIKLVAPGITTAELDAFAQDWLKKRKAKSAFKGYRNYPAYICTSVNEQVVHGIPSSRKLKSGDIIGLDVGVVVDNYYGDAALTVPVGRISPEAERLLQVTQEALYKGIEQAYPGNRLGDISYAVQSHVEKNSFSVVRDFVGHGIGRKLHEDPQVPNFGTPGKGERLRVGMVLAIEPMVNMGGPEVEILEDKWTAVTQDRSLSAHFEHSIAITENGPEILTNLD